jgi:nitrogen regulatory protein P-II 1
MKQIIAYVKPNMLSKVAMALHDLDGLTGLSVTKVQGFGRHRAKGAQDRIIENMVEYVPHLRIEIFCKDDVAVRIATSIQQNAQTGHRGDGKIYVLAVEEAIRISSGEKGDSAI